MRPEFVAPNTIQAAATMLRDYGPEAKIIAGGTAVVLMLRQRLIAPRVLISLGQISGHDHIRAEQDGLHIGSLATLRSLERDEIVNRFCPALRRVFGVVGNIRIRNQATVGGNLAEADYASDPPAMLLALDARLKVTDGERVRILPIGSFFLGFYTTALQSDEIISEVILPPLEPSTRAAYLRYTSRSMEDRPCVGVAAVADFSPHGHCQNLRLAVGAAVETPQRLPEVEEMARGERLNESLISAIAERYARQLDPLSDARGSDWYRREMIQVFIQRALREVRDGDR